MTLSTTVNKCHPSCLHGHPLPSVENLPPRISKPRKISHQSTARAYRTFLQYLLKDSLLRSLVKLLICGHYSYSFIVQIFNEQPLTLKGKKAITLLKACLGNNKVLRILMKYLALSWGDTVLIHDLETEGFWSSRASGDGRACMHAVEDWWQPYIAYDGCKPLIALGIHTCPYRKPYAIHYLCCLKHTAK